MSGKSLCGNTSFKDAFMEAQKRLTLEGNIVISVGLFGRSGDDEVWTEGAGRVRPQAWENCGLFRKILADAPKRNNYTYSC